MYICTCISVNVHGLVSWSYLNIIALSNHGVDVSCIAQPLPRPPAIRSSFPRYYPEMRDLQYRFITLVRKVKGLGKQVEDLKTICIALLNTVISTKRNVQEDMNDLMKCSDGDYIVYLQLYWDHLDCDLLFQLIRQLQKPELETDWDRYKAEVKEACKATLDETRGSLIQRRKLPVHQISVGFETDQPSHDATIQKILDLRDFLKKMMGLEEADFEGFDNAHITLFYTVNRIRLPFLVRLFALHQRSLQEFSITVIFVPGEFIYNVSTDQEFAYPKVCNISTSIVCMCTIRFNVIEFICDFSGSQCLTSHILLDQLCIKCTSLLCVMYIIFQQKYNQF